EPGRLPAYRALSAKATEYVGGAGVLPCRGSRGTLSGGQCEGPPCFPPFSKRSSGLYNPPRVCGKNFPQITLHPFLLPPMARITQRNLFKAYTILVICRPYMQVPINDHRGGEARMPILCATCSTPE